MLCYNEKRVSSRSVFRSGYAWAARREFLDKTGGLFEAGVAGAGDHHMALALVGRVHESAPGDVHSKYLEALWQWQEKALRACTGGLGYVNGSILHSWHGSKRSRQYQSRWRILTEQQFDPTRDIDKNVQGVWELTGSKPALRELLSNYLKSRNEDSRDVN